ncbi:MAG: putative amidoligase enzyme [Harvfovirus sp.]|uniref:Putative amidoligase enzyme n=1 Tax=Harvfovirus sp. TaxID=2487768 RepID=A0A3G5A3Z9_9VIRU|nr:MAG: putative amidoligase enzyme [Harvfovirus sp.]
MLNNKTDKIYKPDLKLITRRNNSQGLHMHISNAHLALVKIGESYGGIGALKMLHFVRTFAYFEGVIRTFLLRPQDIMDRGNHWTKSIYYGRENYIAKKDLAEAHKNVIDRGIRTLLLSVTTPDDAAIAKVFEDVSVHILSKQGRLYSGAFSLKLHNDSLCSPNDVLPNFECKGHIEVRLHHSTDDFAEIYNWCLFINLLLTKCISDVDRLISSGKKFNKVFREVVPNFSVDSGVSVKIFDELFDKYIQSDTLKTFYRSRSQNAEIKSGTLRSKTLFELHPKAIFDSNGEMLKESKLIDLMRAFPLDSTLKLPYDPKEKFEEILK